MKKTFTPGPWKAVRNSCFWEVRPENGDGVEIPFQIGDVCASDPENGDGGLQEANARLIAAAPDLLEELELMVSGLYFLHGNSDGVIAATEKARTIIAKARGEDS